MKLLEKKVAIESVKRQETKQKDRTETIKRVKKLIKLQQYYAAIIDCDELIKFNQKKAEIYYYIRISRLRTKAI